MTLQLTVGASSIELATDDPGPKDGFFFENGRTRLTGEDCLISAAATAFADGVEAVASDAA